LTILEDISFQTQILWTSQVRIVTASRCWRSRCPSTEEVYSASFNLPKKAYRVFERGERGGDPSAAFWQLLQPNPNNPVCIIDLQLTLSHDIHFRASEELFDILTPLMEQQMVFNLTPKYSFVDLHIGKC
jgi:hypothetical protein